MTEAQRVTLLCAAALKPRYPGNRRLCTQRALSVGRLAPGVADRYASAPISLLSATPAAGAPRIEIAAWNPPV